MNIYEVTMLVPVVVTVEADRYNHAVRKAIDAYVARDRAVRQGAWPVRAVSCKLLDEKGTAA